MRNNISGLFTAGALLSAVVVAIIVSTATDFQVTALEWLLISTGFALVVGLVSVVLQGRYTGKLVLATWLIIGFGFWIPFWQPILYGLIYKYPATLQWVLVGLFLIFLSLLVRNDTTGVFLFYSGVIAIVAMGLFLGPMVGSMYMSVHLSDEVMDDVEYIEDLPSTDADNVRIMPHDVGYEVAENRLQYPRNKLGTEDIVFIDGTPHWSFTLPPDGLVNSFRYQQRGAFYSDMSTRSANVHTREQYFTYGEGMLVTDNYMWQLKHDRFWVQHESPFVVPFEDDLYMAVPIITHEHQFRFTPIPQVYSVPRFEGVHLMSSDGTIEFLTAEEAREHPVLEGQRLYPYDLTRLEVSSTRYRHGIINRMFYFEDMIELPNLPGENTQPFLIKTDDGIKYIVSAEPHGDASGVLEIWIADGRTGELQLRQWDPQDTQTGPERAMQYVRQEHPLWDWTEMQPDEPIPTFIDGNLYWNIRVVTAAPLVRSTSFVNATTGEVTTLREDGDVREFVRGEEVSEIDDIEVVEGGFKVTIVDEDGNIVEVIEIQQGHSINIQDLEE